MDRKTYQQLFDERLAQLMDKNVNSDLPNINENSGDQQQDKPIVKAPNSEIKFSESQDLLRNEKLEDKLALS